MPARGDRPGDLAPTPYHIEVRDLVFARGERAIFQGLSCGFPRDKITVIAGASGAGKTTLLRMLACLVEPDSGEIWIDWEHNLATMTDAEIHEYRRQVGMLFQRGALLDSMTLYENAALPLREHTDKSEDEIQADVRAVFEAVDLKGVDGLLPGELSGGMIKRAGLARALVTRPEVLLCDEPFSGLDPPTVRRVEELLIRVNERVGATMIITSHHTHSTLRIADHLVMLLDGKAVSGSPDALLSGKDWRVKDFFTEPGSPLPNARRGRD